MRVLIRLLVFSILALPAVPFVQAQPSDAYELSCPAGYSPVSPLGKTFDAITGMWRANICISDSGNGAMICQTAGCGTTGGITVGSKILYIDGNRTDTYTADGSSSHPFKTISAAIAQVITNADNATFAYQLEIAAATYVETVDLGNAALYNLIFDGNGVVIAPSSGNALQSLANNEQFTAARFYGITFNGPVNLSDPVGFGLAKDGFWFIDARFWGDVTLSKAAIGNGLFYFWSCFSKAVAWTVVNQKDVYFFNGDMQEWPNPAQTKGGSFTISNTTGSALSFATFWGGQYYFTSATVGTLSEIDVYNGLFGNTGTITVNGTFRLMNAAYSSAAVTVNTGGSFVQRAGGTILNTPTFNGGTQSLLGQSGSAKFLSNTFQLNSFTGQQWTAAAGSPEGAVTAPIGSLFSRTDGGAGTSTYFKESGSGNTGWVARSAVASFNAPQRVVLGSNTTTSGTPNTQLTVVTENVTFPAAAGTYRALVSYNIWATTGANVCNAEVVDATNNVTFAPSGQNPNGVGYAGLTGSELSSQTYAASASVTFNAVIVCNGASIPITTTDYSGAALSPAPATFLSVTPVLTN